MKVAPPKPTRVCSNFDDVYEVPQAVVGEVAPQPIAPKVVYKYIPSTYENRADWLNEPCALRKKKCKGGAECHHCKCTPRMDWYNSLIEKEDDTSIYD